MTIATENEGKQIYIYIYTYYKKTKRRKKNCNCATIIHLVRAHTHGFIARFFFSSIIFILVHSVFFSPVFFALVNKTRLKQSVNPIHELRNIHAIGWPSSLGICCCFPLWWVSLRLLMLFFFRFNKIIFVFYSNIYYWDGDLDFTFDQITFSTTTKKKSKEKKRPTKKKTHRRKTVTLDWKINYLTACVRDRCLSSLETSRISLDHFGSSCSIIS